MTRDQGNYSHPMKIVVTGGSGLLGNEVVRTLAAAGATVTWRAGVPALILLPEQGWRGR